MIKTVLLVPRRDNEGRPFARMHRTELETRLAGFAGGLSKQAGVHGVWSFGGRVYRDLSDQYTVGLTSWTQLAGWLSLVQWACARFVQEAMYVEVAGIPEVIPADVAVSA